MPFQKGISGNPGGRPKAEKEVVEAARAAGPRSVEVLVDLLDHTDSRVRMAAAEQLLNRGFGKPKVIADVSADAAIQVRFVE